MLGVGLGILLLGGVLELGPLFQAAQWQRSPEAAQAERNAVAPMPVWIRPTYLPTAATRSAAPRATAAAAPTQGPVLGTPIALDARIAPPPTPTPSTSDLQLAATTFTFDDPPQPGAHAHLDLRLRNPTDQPSGPVVVSLPTAWLAGYRLEGITPSPADGNQSGGALRLSFDGPPPAGELNVQVQFVTTDEVIDSPSLTVYDAEGRVVGDSHPPTEAPPSTPGPIYSIDIPRLKLHTGVVQVDWEPPLFVVGQVRSSAWVTRGNSVLVGHVRGATGYNVFIHLDQLEVGDAIVANSRGQSYNFAVSDKQNLPEDDTSPTEPTRSARLTLMTCAGDWNPLTQDYSDRLWVTAEPQQ
jgi:LPXTG-site transpeptidase (sortase) family protein